MVRFAPMIAAVAAASLATCGAARAASDITLAAIATGRLYVVGTTERPRTPVVLDGQFRTESNDKGQFQYELVYHPAHCIVSATIDGRPYDAVVSNCGEKCSAPPVGAAGKTSAAPAAASQPAPASRPPAPKPSSSARGSGTAMVTPPTAAAPRPPVPDATSAVRRKAPRPDARAGVGESTVNPASPPARPSSRAETRTRPPRPAREVRQPRIEPRENPPETDTLPED